MENLSLPLIRRENVTFHHQSKPLKFQITMLSFINKYKNNKLLMKSCSSLIIQVAS